MVEIKNLRFGYDKPLFDGLSFTFPEKGTVAVTGGSGAGKTTLLRIIAGLIDTDCVTRKGRVAFLFQNDRLFPWLTAAKNISLISSDGKYEPYLSSVGLADSADTYPDSLSGGMRRRVALAAVLAAKADIILLDEPTANLDAENAGNVRRLIADEAKRALVIIASHSPEDISLADSIIDLNSPDYGIKEQQK